MTERQIAKCEDYITAILALANASNDENSRAIIRMALELEREIYPVEEDEE